MDCGGEGVDLEAELGWDAQDGGVGRIGKFHGRVMAQLWLWLVRVAELCRAVAFFSSELRVVRKVIKSEEGTRWVDGCEHSVAR